MENSGAVAKRLLFCMFTGQNVLYFVLFFCRIIQLGFFQIARKLSKGNGAESDVDCIMKPGGSFNGIHVFKMFLLVPVILFE